MALGDWAWEREGVNITEKALEGGKGQAETGHSPGAQNMGVVFRNPGDPGVCQPPVSHPASRSLLVEGGALGQTEL